MITSTMFAVAYTIKNIGRAIPNTRMIDTTTARPVGSVEVEGMPCIQVSIFQELTQVEHVMDVIAPNVQETAINKLHRFRERS